MLKPEHIPFVEVTKCETCGSLALKKIHDQTYPGPEGYYRLVIYQCPFKHETKTRQLILKSPFAKDNDDWDGHT